MTESGCGGILVSRIFLNPTCFLFVPLQAVHVTASVVKMMKRIVDTDNSSKKALSQIPDLFEDESEEDLTAMKDLAGHSYGITSSPLTQFAVVLSSIIHDADRKLCLDLQTCLDQSTSMQCQLTPPFPSLLKRSWSAQCTAHRRKLISGH